MPNSKAESKILSIAARLVRGLPKISSYAEDMPKSTPKSVLRDIEIVEDWARNLGADLALALKELRKERYGEGTTTRSSTQVR